MGGVALYAAKATSMDTHTIGTHRGCGRRRDVQVLYHCLTQRRKFLQYGAIPQHPQHCLRHEDTCVYGISDIPFTHLLHIMPEVMQCNGCRHALTWLW